MRIGSPKLEFSRLEVNVWSGKDYSCAVRAMRITMSLLTKQDRHETGRTNGIHTCSTGSSLRLNGFFHVCEEEFDTRP